MSRDFHSDPIGVATLELAAGVLAADDPRWASFGLSDDQRAEVAAMSAEMDASRANGQPAECRAAARALFANLTADPDDDDRSATVAAIAALPRTTHDAQPTTELGEALAKIRRY